MDCELSLLVHLWIIILGITYEIPSNDGTHEIICKFAADLSVFYLGSDDDDDDGES